jgi:hypothetical protein
MYTRRYLLPLVSTATLLLPSSARAADEYLATLTIQSTINTLQDSYADTLMDGVDEGQSWSDCGGFTAYAVPFDLSAGWYRATVVAGGIDVWNGSCGGGSVIYSCTGIGFVVPSSGVRNGITSPTSDSPCGMGLGGSTTFKSGNERVFFYHSDIDNHNNVGATNVDVYRIDTDADDDGQDDVQYGGTDCDDSNPEINTASPDYCDAVDGNCNGVVDDMVWYADYDEDGYGNPDDAKSVCDQPDGRVAIGGDCNDEDPRTYPGAEEMCDDQDNNCDGQIDEGYEDQSCGCTLPGSLEALNSPAGRAGAFGAFLLPLCGMLVRRRRQSRA